MDKTVTHISDVPLDQVDDIWPFVSPLLDGALRHGVGEYTLDDIYRGICLKHMILWVVFDGDGQLYGVVVCEIRDFTSSKTCYLLLLGGRELPLWAHHVDTVEDWAITNGADRMVALTRKGMKRTWTDCGYNEVYTAVTKPLQRRIH